MHWGLPSVESMVSLAFVSSESGFETSVNSTILAWASEISPSGSWISSYVLSSSDVISIWNAVVGISEVLEYSCPSLKSYNLIIKQSRLTMSSTFFCNSLIINS